MFMKAAVLLLGTLVTAVRCVDVEYKFSYFSNATLDCDSTLLNLPQYTVYKVFWLLPDGTDIQWNHDPGNTSRYTVSPYPIYNLTISHVTDEDFGWYRCVILWDDYIFLVHSLNIGLNVDGALYDDIFESYKQSALVALIAGGCTAILSGLLCLLYWCRYSETNRVNENEQEDDDKKLLKKINKKKHVSTPELTDEEDTITEKEVIYALDKAVRGYDVEETTKMNGEIAVITISSKQLEDDIVENVEGPELEPKSDELHAAVEDSKTQNTLEDILDCYEHIPTPPPPPPPESLPEEEPEELNVCDDVTYYNKAFEADDYEDEASADDKANVNVEIDSDINMTEIKSHFDTMKSFTFQEELMARLMNHGKQLGSKNEDGAKAGPDDEFERVHF